MTLNLKITQDQYELLIDALTLAGQTWPEDHPKASELASQMYEIWRQANGFPQRKHEVK